MTLATESSFSNSPTIPDDPRARYDLLRWFRDNQAYRQLRGELSAFGNPSDFHKIRALENVCEQATSFHVMHVFPGTLEEAFPVELEPDDPLRVAAYRILRDGRFGIQKDYAVETTATCGDVFFQARLADSAKAVYPDVIDPDFVTEFEEDNRGNITYIRLDWDDLDSETGEVYTEIYSKEDDFYALWHHLKGLGGDVEDETPVEPYPVKMSSFGHDFVPFVRFPARQSFKRGELCKGVFEPHLELIVQQNRDLTVLSDRYFRHGKPTMQVRRGEAGQAAVDMQWDPAEDERFERERTERGEKRIKEEPLGGDETVIRQPGLAYLEYLVPDINWTAGLDQIERHRQSLGRSMSEIRFFDGIDKGDPSALAITKHQDPSYRRAKALRANGEEAVLAVIKMCISIKQARGIYDASLGSFDSGDFDRLVFKARPISPETAAEKALRRTAEAGAYSAAREVSPAYLKDLLLEDGFDEEAAERIVKDSGSGRGSQLDALFNGG